MKKRLVSACLLGIKCRYDCTSKINEKVLKILETEVLISVCPEQLGGLSTPRAPSEQKEGRVISKEGYDITNNFNIGAREVLKIAQTYKIKEAILKQRSPSCGSGQIYDGTFSGTIIKGDGVTTSLLKEYGINVISEEQI